MYAGLASAMIALVFLYICASIFIYGGELNSVIAAHAMQREKARKLRKIRKRRRKHTAKA
jgi:membrane protein